MFHVSRECFHLLCKKIIYAICETEFKSEFYIDAFLRGKDEMFNAHEHTSSGYISGETKFVVTLYILSGSNSCDL